MIGLGIMPVFAGLMVLVILADLRKMRIPHALLAVIALLFVIEVLPTLTLTTFLWRLLAAGIVLALCFAAFAARRLGGGDAKLLPLLILFVPSGDLALFALCLSAGLIVGLVAVRLLRTGGMLAGSSWRGITQTDRYPLGPGIGLGGITYALFGPTLAAAF